MPGDSKNPLSPSEFPKKGCLRCQGRNIALLERILTWEDRHRGFLESRSGSFHRLPPKSRHTRPDPFVRQRGRSNYVPAQWAGTASQITMQNQVKVDLGIMAIKRYSTFPSPHHQMEFNAISRKHAGGGLNPMQRCSHCLLQPHPTRLEKNF